jgi:hypothetical protein
MDITQKFREANICHFVKVNKLQVDKKYSIVDARRADTKYGECILLSIRDSPTNIVKVFLPKRYSLIITDDDIEAINSAKVILHLIYKGTCVTTNSFLLEIE